MKRDMELVSKILFEIENADLQSGWISDFHIEGYSEAEVTYHIMIMAKEGLIEAQNLSSMDGIDWKPVSLTWQGHEFLDSIRNDDVWSGLKDKFGSQLSTLPLQAISAVAIEMAKKWALGKLGLD